jgi:S-DNA-T family DNA segregation ATPase FtsK/SpoIIIE
MNKSNQARAALKELVDENPKYFSQFVSRAGTFFKEEKLSIDEYELVKSIAQGDYDFEFDSQSGIGKKDEKLVALARKVKSVFGEALEQARLAGLRFFDDLEHKLPQLKAYHDAKAAPVEQDIQQIKDTAMKAFHGFPVPLWVKGSAKKYNFSRTYIARDFFILHEQTPNNQPIPFVFPYIGTDKTIVIQHDGSENIKKNTDNSITEAIMRLSAWMPYNTKFSLLDPEGLGKAFPYQSKLINVRSGESSDVNRTLDAILDDMQRIQSSVLSTEAKTLLDLDEELRSGEPFEFIVAANFPNGYDRRACETLQKVANIGSTTGRYVIIQRDASAELPHGIQWDGFKHYFNAWKHAYETALAPRDKARIWGLPFNSEDIDELLDGIAKNKPEEKKLEFSHLADTNNPDNWWKEDATNEIRTAVGGAGGRKADLEVWFGSHQSQTCSHGMLGAATGAGKSNLYHVIIMTLAMRYSPDELQFYLIDGKQGVEFQNYPVLPHARVVCLHSSPSMARSVLGELVDEMERRNTLFKKHNVEDITEYKKEGSPGGNVPRLMLMVDEYQTLFEDDREGMGSDLMYKLSAQGRSAGIHMLVGSQRFGAPDMTKQSAIFNNIHLRIGMMMSESDITALQEFGPAGKKMLRACSQKGQAVINDGLGDDNANKSGRIAFLERDVQKRLLNELQQKWADAAPAEKRFDTVLLDGTAQPLLSGNHQLQHLMHSYISRPSADQMKSFATLPEVSGGPHETEWYSVEKPAIMWLGKELNIHGQAHFVFRRRAHEHLLMIGDSNEARLGMFTLAVGQLALNFAPDDYQIYAIDRALPGSPWHGVIEKAITGMKGSGTFANNSDDIAKQVSEIRALLDKRRSMDEDDILTEKAVFWVINSAQRFKNIHKPDDAKTDVSDTYELLMDVLEHGGELGIHLMMNFDTVRALQKVFSRKETDEFRHRIALQMSEEDSFSLIKSRAAAKLQYDGPKPVFALYLDQMQNRSVPFKPYCFEAVDEQPALDVMQTQLDLLFSTINRWSGAS